MDIGAPSGRLIGGRNNVIIHLMTFSPQNTCLCFSILNYRYSVLPVPASYVSFFALFNLRNLLYIISKISRIVFVLLANYVSFSRLIVHYLLEQWTPLFNEIVLKAESIYP